MDNYRYNLNIKQYEAYYEAHCSGNFKNSKYKNPDPYSNDDAGPSNEGNLALKRQSEFEESQTKRKRVEAHEYIETVKTRREYVETISTKTITTDNKTEENLRPRVLTTISTTEVVATSPEILTEPILSEDESDYDPEQSPVFYTESIDSADEYNNDDDENKPYSPSDEIKKDAHPSLHTESISSDEDVGTATKKTKTNESYPILYTETISSDDDDNDSVEMVNAEPPPSTENSLYDPYADTFSELIIAPWNYPDEKFTEKQESALRNTLLEEMFKCPPGKSPTFDDSYFKRGSMVINCANDESRTWLFKNVPRLQPWKGAVLKVGRKEEILNNNKFTVFIPKKIINLTNVRKILEILEKQNKQIVTKYWRIIASTSDTRGILITLNIDYDSYCKLKEVKCQLYLGLGQIEFKELN